LVLGYVYGNEEPEEGNWCGWWWWERGLCPRWPSFMAVVLRVEREVVVLFGVPLLSQMKDVSVC
jgi:hypothetical protein